MARRGITLAQKYRVVDAITDGLSQTAVAKKFGFSKSTVSLIWKRKEKIVRAYEDRRPETMRLRRSDREDLDSELYAWYRTRVNAGRTVTGPELKLKANEFARRKGDEKFDCSLGWIDRFKVRHDISLTRGVVEQSSRNEHDFWPRVGADFPEKDVFVIKEVGLYYAAGPEGVGDLRGRVCDSGEDAERRLTVCLCTNRTGSDKRRLLVVGRRPYNPDCTLPAVYRADKRSWMTMAISGEELNRWNQELSTEGRRILLLVQYSPAFRTFDDHSNIKMGYLRSDGKDHPMELVVKCFKINYRKYLLKCIYGEKQKRKLNPYRVSVHEAIKMLHKSWLRISQSTILEAFRLEDSREEIKNRVVLFEKWFSKRAFATKVRRIDLAGYIEFDDDLVTSVKFTSDAADMEESSSSRRPKVDDHAIDSNTEGEVPSAEEALRMARSIYTFLEKHKADVESLNFAGAIEILIEDVVETS